MGRAQPAARRVTWLGGARLICGGEWAYSRRPNESDPAQGWKLHVSATLVSAPDVFRRAAPVLFARNVLFKVPHTLEHLARLNCGMPHFSQIGKFITAYPQTPDEAVELAAQLHAATRGFRGPDVPSDIHYRKGSNVFYRYGAFAQMGPNGAFLTRPDGRRVAEKRERRYAVPAWQRDPFAIRKTRSEADRGPLGRDYLRYKVLAQRGRGGVYQAIDIASSPARIVVVKEGRRNGETDFEHRDGYARVRGEAVVLRALHKAGVPAPKILQEFTQNGSRYLVLEKLPGGRISTRRASWRRAARLLDQLGAVLDRIHAAGWVWRDCKPSHVFIHRGEVRLIDFEHACRVEERALNSWATPEFSRVRNPRSRRKPGVQEDDYALGVTVFLIGAGRIPSRSASGRSRIYRETDCPPNLLQRIEELLAA